jgi:hypothetical protein
VSALLSVWYVSWCHDDGVFPSAVYIISLWFIKSKATHLQSHRSNNISPTKGWILMAIIYSGMNFVGALATQLIPPPPPVSWRVYEYGAIHYMSYRFTTQRRDFNISMNIIHQENHNHSVCSTDTLVTWDTEWTNAITTLVITTRWRTIQSCSYDKCGDCISTFRIPCCVSSCQVYRVDSRAWCILRIITFTLILKSLRWEV